MRTVERLIKRARIYFERDHDILGRTIRLPPGHMLDWIRLHHKRYDMPLTDVAAEVVRAHSGALMIDIGANVGDSAAFLAVTKDTSILCIEGNPTYAAFLRKNLAKVSPSSVVVQAYVGETDQEIAGYVVPSHGTASIQADDCGAIQTLSLSTILNRFPKFKKAKLLKIDTDGYDAKIVNSSIGLLQEMKPVIFLEYYPIGAPAVASEYRQMLENLAAVGYVAFHVFDNFGNHMLRVQAEQIHQMRALTAYVRSTQRGERPSLNYYDICAIPAEEMRLSDRLLRRYDWDC